MVLSIVLIFMAATLTKGKDVDPLSDAFITDLNKNRAEEDWTAGRNFRADTPMAHIQGLMGLLEHPTFKLPAAVKHGAKLIAKLPKDFDARKIWSNCPSLKEIRDQGSCGSCWATAAVEVMTDRVCIYSKGTKQFHFSTQDLTSCECTGCFGGDPGVAWDYWVKEGIVSGGLYNSSQGCRPYELPPCEHMDGKRPQCQKPTGTPDCVKKCAIGYNVNYSKDKRRGKKAYSLDGEDQIRAELYSYGPVEASFRVYEDFIHYKSGVYLYRKGNFIGEHAVKILGWGMQYKRKLIGFGETIWVWDKNYWLCANSWGTDWGDKGFFKILRKKNYLELESGACAGEPDLAGL